MRYVPSQLAGPPHVPGLGDVGELGWPLWLHRGVPSDRLGIDKTETVKHLGLWVFGRISKHRSYRDANPHSPFATGVPSEKVKSFKAQRRAVTNEIGTENQHHAIRPRHQCRAGTIQAILTRFHRSPARALLQEAIQQGETIPVYEEVAACGALYLITKRVDVFWVLAETVDGERQGLEPVGLVGQ